MNYEVSKPMYFSKLILLQELSELVTCWNVEIYAGLNTGGLLYQKAHHRPHGQEQNVQIVHATARGVNNAVACSRILSRNLPRLH